MSKKRKPMDDMPTMGTPYPTSAPVVSVENVAVVETSTAMNDPVLAVVISAPCLPWDGHARKSLDVRLTSSQAGTLKGIQLGLEKQEATLLNGKFVANPVDAIRWMLENAK